MNLRFYVIFAAVLLTLVESVSFASGVPFLADKNVTATVHGATYAGDSFEPLNDTVVEINSTPPQSMVAKNGIYSFELVPGDYSITARHYQNNTLIYFKEATLKIEVEGYYVFDLLLYPVSESSIEVTTGARVPDVDSMDPPERNMADSLTISYLSIALMLFLLLGGGYKLSTKNKNAEKSRFQNRKFSVPGLSVKIPGKSTDSGVEPGNIEDTAFVTEPILELTGNSDIETDAQKMPPLPADLREVLDIIRGHKGRISQKDLRNKLEYSEVKVSLMLTELEKRGLIKKLRNGRENILVLLDQER